MSLLVRDRAALVVVDVQEAFRPYASFAGVAESCAKLLQGARILGLPSVVTEQYPKGLGHTAPELGLQDERPIEKTVFSAARAERFDLAGREQALVCGIETHVCVSQTVHDLLHLARGALDRGAMLEPRETFLAVVGIVGRRTQCQPDVRAVRHVEVGGRDAGYR